MRRASGTSAIVAVALAAAVVLGGCSTDDSSSETARTSASVQSTTGAADSAESGAPATQGPEETVGGIPVYEPSNTVSEGLGSTVVTTSDPIDKVSDYYVDFVEREGWQKVSRSVTPYSTSLTVKKSGKGASISISGGGDGVLVSISTYPSP